MNYTSVQNVKMTHFSEDELDRLMNAWISCYLMVQSVLVDTVHVRVDCAQQTGWKWKAKCDE